VSSGGDRRIRVLHVIQNLNYGGMEKLMADLVHQLDPRLFESHVLTLEYQGRYGRDMAGYAEVHSGPAMSKLSLLRPVALARCIASLRPDVVHTHSGVWYKAARAARLAGAARVIHTEHGRQPDTLVSRLIDRRAARLTDVLVAVSTPLRGFLEGRLGRAAPRIVVVHNGVDVATLRPAAPSGQLRSELGLADGQPIVGSVGRLEPVKGYEVVLEAFALLSRRVTSRPVLVIAGDGSARPALEAAATRLGVRDRVHLLGWRDDTADLLAHFRCFVLGSWSEGTSVSLLEAMASGIAPVVTAVGGNADVLGPALADQLVPAGDAMALANGLERVLHPGAAGRVASLARRRVEAAFSLSAMVGEYASLYANGATVGALAREG